MTARTRLWTRVALSLFLYGGMVLGFVTAQSADDTKKKPAPAPMEFKLPDGLAKIAPENIEELREIEKHVQKVIDKVMPAVVGVQVGAGQGSGVIIREDGLILTAGHVSGNPNQNATITLPNGVKKKAKTLGQYKSIDSGMVKITDPGPYPFLEMGKSANLKKGQWVIAIGHPGGFRANRTPVVRLGRILIANEFEIRTDCTLVGGDSGGPLFDMQGRVIGIHSRIGGFAITENVHVPIDTYRQTFTKLEKGESWGTRLGEFEAVRPAGGKVVFDKKDKITSDDPTILAPHDIAKDTPKADAKQSHFKTFTFRMKAGSTYTIDMIAAAAKKKKADNVFDPFLRLESPAGKMLAEDDDGAGGMNSRIVYKALKDGDYRITATTFEGEQTGTFTLKIYEADFKDALVSGKVEVLRAIKIPLPAITRVVEEAKKLNVPLHVNAILIDDKGDPLANKEIVLTWEKGTQKLKSDNQGVVRWQLAHDKTKQLNLQLPTGIRAMLGVTDKDGNGLKVLKEDPGLEKVKSAGGKIVQTFDGVLKKTDPFDFEREKCVRHVHEFKMQAGKTYTIDLASDEFDAYLRLEDADGNKLAEDDDGAGFLNSRIVYTPTTAAAYRIVATTCDPDTFGAYRVTIRETNAAATEPKKDEKK